MNEDIKKNVDDTIEKCKSVEGAYKLFLALEPLYLDSLKTEDFIESLMNSIYAREDTLSLGDFALTLTYIHIYSFIERFYDLNKSIIIKDDSNTMRCCFTVKQDIKNYLWEKLNFKNIVSEKTTTCQLGCIYPTIKNVNSLLGVDKLSQKIIILVTEKHNANKNIKEISSEICEDVEEVEHEISKLLNEGILYFRHTIIKTEEIF